MKSSHLIKVSFFILALNLIISATFAQRQVYVVYLGEHHGQRTQQEIEDTHHSYLHSVKGSLEEAKTSKIYSYTKAINGFAALLTPEEANAISEMDGVISVTADKPRVLATTRSWDFIDLLQSDWDPSKLGGLEELQNKANNGTDVIIGVLDTGIWPESESFDDTGMDAVPSSWKGICESGTQFTEAHCNRKIIGARYYLKGYEAAHGPLNPAWDIRSARDNNGHGTHVASTVAGRRVANASTPFGFGRGTVRGGATKARLAVYKVCWSRDCRESDMVAAFDDAIGDGVDVISVSIVPLTSIPFTRDGEAIAALHASKRNIVVAFAAGNAGPSLGTVYNVAPWTITVASSSADRAFSSPLLLGNGILEPGQSVTPFEQATYPLVYAGDIEIPGTTTKETSGQCHNGTLSPILAKGKAVFCLSEGEGAALEVQRAGGAAVVLQNNKGGIGVSVKGYPIPATVVLANETKEILDYIRNSITPTATLLPAVTVVGAQPAPYMAFDSSRGPVAIERNLLKPDVTAPGLSILAAWTQAFWEDHKFDFSSGTSMACPHVSAVAALLKSIHPTWSSAAIQSAIMTTARVTNDLGNPITDAWGDTPATPFAYGSGHIQPSKAADPGLVYDITHQEYLYFLCANSGISIDPSEPCLTKIRRTTTLLNYPSVTFGELGPAGFFAVRRQVTNVGGGSPIYRVTISQPAGYRVTISPTTLFFSPANQTQEFFVTVSILGPPFWRNQYEFGSFTWSDGQGHEVRSPLTLVSPDSQLIAST